MPWPLVNEGGKDSFPPFHASFNKAHPFMLFFIIIFQLVLYFFSTIV